MKVHYDILSPSVTRSVAVMCMAIFATTAHPATPGINVWTSHGPPFGTYAVALDPGTPSTLYAGTGDGGFFKSTDAGDTWVAADAGLPHVFYETVGALAIDPITPRTLYAGTAGGRVFKSTDGAANWYWHVADGLPRDSIGGLVIDPITPSTLYVRTGGGVFKSTDGAANWHAVDGLPSDSIGEALAIGPRTPSTLYVGTSNICTFGGCGGVRVSGVFRSTDGGVTWKAGGLTSRVYALAIDPMTPSTLYAGTSYVEGIFKSTDGGDTWKPTANEGLPDLSSVGSLAVVIDPVTPSTLYVGTAGSGVFKSTDAGASWNALNTGLANLFATALVIDPITPSKVYAGTSGGVFAIEQVTPCVGDCDTQTPTPTLTPTATLAAPPTCVDNCTQTPTPTPSATPPSPSPTALRALLTKITTGDIVTTPAWYWNGAWGDYDDDGYLDLFVGSNFASKRNFLYHNNRDGTFTLIDAAKMPKIPSNQHGAAWGDYDNDGHLDLIVTAGNPEVTHNVLYHNNGDGTFSGITDGPIYTGTFRNGFHAPSWGDYDNDGFLDLFIAGHDIVNRLFHNNGDGSFTRILSGDGGAGVLVSDLGASEGRAWVDYDNDGDLDLFVSNGAAPYTSFLYRNDGHGMFTKVTDSGLTDRVEESLAVCWADYDNDGFLDLFLANSQVNSLYHNNRDGTFTRIIDSAMVTEVIPPGVVFPACAWGDYDNDGFIDLFVTTGCFPASPDCIPRHNLLYHNSGDGTFTKVTEGSVVNDPTTQCVGASWGDYDKDGFLDLFVAQGAFWTDPQTNLLYHNDGNSNAWLNVKLVGTVSNRSAIGAKVRVSAFYRGERRWQMRELSGGDEDSNQSNALNAEFGLADATTVDTVRVEWPSGTVRELHDVAPRQFLTITEPYCAGDCSNEGQVTVDKLLVLVNIALGNAPRSACPHGVGSSAAVDIALIIQAVNNALSGCGGQ